MAWEPRFCEITHFGSIAVVLLVLAVQWQKQQIQEPFHTGVFGKRVLSPKVACQGEYSFAEWL
jgi:hypothetical protein